MSEPSEIAAKLKVSEESTLFFIGKMAREKKVKITGIKLQGGMFKWRQNSIQMK